MNYFVLFVFIRERFVLGRSERGLSLGRGGGDFEFYVSKFAGFKANCLKQVTSTAPWLAHHQDDFSLAFWGLRNQV